MSISNLMISLSFPAMTATINSLLEKTQPQPEEAKIDPNQDTAQVIKLPETATTIKTPEPTKTAKTLKTNKATKTAKTLKTSETRESPSYSTLELAAKDVRAVIDQQREQSSSMTTKLNILFVTNGALFTSLSISRLLFVPSPFSIAELLGFLINFSLLINAFLPRQLAVSPNLGDKKFLERYLVLSPEDYQLRMIVNLVETYNANKQRLEDVSSSLKYSAYVTWGVALIVTLHVLTAYVFPIIDLSNFG